MKPHLPFKLRAALLAALVAVSFTLYSPACAAETGDSLTETKVYEHNEPWTDRIIDSLTLDSYAEIHISNNELTDESGGAISLATGSEVSITNSGIILFENNSFSSSSFRSGGAIYNYGTLTFSCNGDITFSGNSSYSDGAIYNSGALDFTGNGDITFSSNSALDFGGAISNYYSGRLSFTGNGDIAFAGNSVDSSPSSSHGGAIYNRAALDFTENGAITFSGNYSSASGGAICNWEGTLAFANNGDITFSGNYSSTSRQAGGAICNPSGTLSFTGNGNITFSGNFSGIFGGAIENPSGTLSFTGNGDIIFSGNSSGSGGAICNLNGNNGGGTLEFTNNGNITFSRNSASGSDSDSASGGAIGNSASKLSFTGNGDISFSSNSADYQGGAIDNSCTLEFTNNGAITFSGNSASQSGAIYNAYGDTLSFTGNGAIAFSGNSADSSTAGAHFYGGAIGNSGTLDFSRNGDITFSGNSADSSTADVYLYGGAISNYYSGSRLSFTGNGDITFSGNYATYKGGAIYNYGTLDFTGNGDITFSGNSADSSTADAGSYGGAIYNDGTLNFRGNGDITFSGNSAAASYASSGAIYNSGTLDFTGNGDITFSGNSASDFDSSDGGAIYNFYGTLSFSGNDSVLFEKNYEKKGDSYRLRSIYSLGGSMYLAAQEGGYIAFKDSLYSSSDANCFFNACLDENGSLIPSCGEIIFTSESTEADLAEIMGCTPTEAQISESRTSYVGKATTLYGGTVSILEQAILQGSSLTVQTSATKGGTRVLLRNGTLSMHSIMFQSGTVLEAQGSSSLAGYVTMAADSTLQFTLGEAASPILTLTGTLVQKGNLLISLAGNAEPGTYTLLSVSKAFDKTNWTEESVSVTGASFADLSWDEQGKTLYLDYKGSSSLATAVVWNGGGSWNSYMNNWQADGNDSQFVDGMHVRFTDAWAGSVAITETLAPSSVVVENSAGKDYTFCGMGQISGNAGLTKLGNGTLTIKTANSYTGGTTINAGYVIVGSGSALSTGDVNLNGGDLDMGGNALCNAVNVNTDTTINGGENYQGWLILNNGTINGGALNLGQDATVNSGTINNNLTGTGGILKETGNSVTLNGSNSYTGGTTINRGSIVAGSGSALGTGDVNLNGGDLDMGGNALGNAVIVNANATINGGGNYQGGLILNNGIVNGGTLNLGQNFTANKGVINNDLTGTGGILKETGNSVTLNGSNSYTGGTTINRGSIIAGSGSALSTGDVNLNGGDLDMHGWDLDNDIIVTQNGVLNGAGDYCGSVTLRNGTLSGGSINVAVGKTFVLEQGTLSNKLTGEGNVSKVTDGSVTLNGNNTFAGGSTISAGSLTAGHFSAFGTGTITLGGGTLNLNGQAVVNAITATGGKLSGADNYNGALTVNGSVTLEGTTAASSLAVKGGSLTGGRVIDTSISATSGTVSSVISGTSSVMTSGDVTLRGANDYTGATAVSGGMLTVGNASALGGSTVALNGSLDMGGFAVSNTINIGSGELGTIVNGTAFAGTVNLNGGTLSLADTLGGTLALNGGLLDLSGMASATLGKVTTSSLTSINVGDLSGLGEGSHTLLLLSDSRGVDTSLLQIVGADGITGWNTALEIQNGNLMLVLSAITEVILDGGIKEIGDGVTITPEHLDIGGDEDSLITGGGSIAGNGNLDKDGKGNLTIDTKNSDWTGDINVNGGTVTAGNDTALGTGDVNLNGGSLNLGGWDLNNDIIVMQDGVLNGAGDYCGTLTLRSGSLTGGSINIAAGKTCVLEQGTLDNKLTGEGGVSKGTDGSVTLNGNNTFAGGTAISAGSLTAGHASAFGTGDVALSGGTLNLNGRAVANDITATGGTLDGAAAYTGALTVSGSVTLGGATTASRLAVNGGSLTGGSINNTAISATSGTLSSTISGSSSVATSGDVTLGGANDYTGATSISGGMLTVGNASALGGSTVALNGSLNLDGLAVSNTINIGSGEHGTIVNGTAFAGTVNLNGGTLSLADTLGGTLALNGGLLDLGGMASATLGTVTTSSQTSINVGDLSALGEGTHTLLSLADGSSVDTSLLQIVGADGLTGWNTALEIQGNDLVLVLSALPQITDDIILDGGNKVLDSIATPGSIQVSGDADSSISGAGSISGDGNLDKTGGGNLTIGTENPDWTGDITISGGTVTAGSDTALGAGDVTMNGGSLNMGGRDLNNDIIVMQDGVLNGAGDYCGTLTLRSGTLTGGSINISSDKTFVLEQGTLGNKLTGEGGVSKVTDDSVTLNGNNTFAGGTAISAGTLTAGHASAFGSGDINLNDGTLNLNGQAVENVITATGGMLDGADNYNGALTVNGSVSLAGPITAASLTVNSGRLTGGSVKDAAVTIKGGVIASSITGNSTVTLKGGTLDTSATNTLTATSLVLNGGTLSTRPGAISLSGNLSILGATTINLGELTEGDYTVLSAASISGSTNLLSLVGDYYSYTWNVADNALTLHVVTDAPDNPDPIDPVDPDPVDPDPVTTDNVVLSGNQNVTNDTVISGNAKVEVNGKGTLTLTKANSYTGGTTITSGTLVAGADGALGRGDVTLHGGKLDIGGHALTDNKTRVKDTSHIAAGNGGRLASLDLSTPGVGDGDGTQLFGGVLTLTGTLELESLRFGKGAISGGSLRVHKAITAEGGTIAANLSGTATFTKNSRGTLTLKGRNNWTGRTTINEGRLVIAGQSTVSSLDINGGSLAVTRSGSLTVTDVFSVCGNEMELSSPITLNTTMGGNLLDLLRANGCEVQNENGAIVFSPGTPAASVAMLLADTAEETAVAEESTGMTGESADVAGGEAAESSGEAADGKAAGEAILAAIMAAAEPAPSVGTDALAQGTWGVAKAARLFADTVRDHAGLGSTAALDETGTRSAWFSAMSSFSRTDGNGAAAGADTDIYGGALGMQFNGSRGGNVGIAVGQTWGHISPMGGSSRVTQKTQHAALYANKVLVNRERDFAGVSATAAYATTDSDTVQNGHRFDWAQQSAVLGLRGTWVHHISNATAVYCYTGAEYLATDSASTENGESGSVQSLKWEAGTGVSHTAGKFTVYADAAFRPDIVRHNPVAESDGWRGGVSNPGRLELRATIGADYRVNEHWSLSAGYSYEGAARENNHNLRAGVGYTF